MSELVHSEKMKEYFQNLEDEAENCYELAEKARSLGYDPEEEVEIPRAEDLALRAEELTEVENTAEKIRELSEKYDRGEVSIRIAKEVASREKGSVSERLEDAIRIGLAVLTEGILVAPLEGIGGIEIKDEGQGTNYLELSFAGPIRSAGGTGQAMTVLIADVVRREMGIGEFKATAAEIQRFKEEIPLYKKSLGLQYTPSAEEISLIIKGCPVSISGEGTGREEVSGNRDLPRVDTNQVRGGACLVIAEGMCLKAKKLKKYVKKLDIEGWDFLDEYIDEFASGKKDSGEGAEEEEKKKEVSPKTKYIEETIAGRPVFSHPSENGGFRLRYGRTRSEGLASVAVNPAGMYLTNEFLALGTQIKTERPGKAGAITPCDTIEGPTVLLKDGSVRRVDSPQESKELQDQVEEIIDLGEMLIPYGEFVENNHTLVPGAYCHEWWVQEIEEDLEEDDITADKAVELSKEKGYPLHPEYVYFWNYASVDEIKRLRDRISEEGDIKEEGLFLPQDPEIKEIMEEIGLPHRSGENLIVEEYRPLLFSLGLEEETLQKPRDSDKSEVLDYLSELAGVPIKDKSPTSIGSRMARPEKAKERKMSPPVHGLFPLSEAGGSERLVKKAVDEGIIEVEISARRCKKCGKSSAQIRCSCGGRCEIIDDPKEQKIPMKNIYREALSTLGEGGNVQKIKGVKGLITETKTPEALEKGILRAKHGIYVFKDGTSRYDMTDLPITHFKPEEIGLTVSKARKLGYEKDIEGQELKSEDQMIDLKPQDMVISKDGGKYMVKVADFVDDLLKKYYDMDTYYDAESKEDLVGELVVGLAPHTSGGVLGRIIGYHEGRACYAHPHFHAAKRRNCDGDEDCIMLLLDGLLNFSEGFLPEKRGGLMDAPLVMTTKIDPSEIDSEAHNVDTLWEYPLEFYEETLEYADPKEVGDLIETVEDRLGEEGQYENFGYTHETSDIAQGPSMSRYTRLGKMTTKMDAQLKVADMIRAVDTTDVVSRVINDHFIPDLIGNLNKFGVQQIRCTKCNTKYRRMPLSGKCKCGGNLTLTIHEGSVNKYLNFSLEMVEKYEVSEYLYQRVKQLERQIESLFENDKVSNPSLDEFC
ncbi:MAG: DNA polymerase II large subunit [Candidatus Thermoplasmatota archaeon]|nr:DNA polymerase II large subunit [Candidatus Thermoplasmatota archaeon]